MPLTGGRGSFPRVLVGTLIIATINSALVIRGIQPYWTTIITGVLLILALGVREGDDVGGDRPPDRGRRASRPTRPSAEGRRMSVAVPALELIGIEKHYGFLKALDDVDFHVRVGEVVAVVGDNGAGKSTLLKVMSGAHRPTHGTIRVRGDECEFHSPRAAADAGIQMVYQDLALVDAADIATNLTLGREPLRRGPLGWLGFLDKKAMRQEAERELRALGVTTAPPGRLVEMLSGGQRQVVALARSAVRVTDRGHGVLLLDEPTAALGYAQSRQVASLIRTMADRGDRGGGRVAQPPARASTSPTGSWS